MFGKFFSLFSPVRMRWKVSAAPEGKAFKASLVLSFDTDARLNFSSSLGERREQLNSFQLCSVVAGCRALSEKFENMLDEKCNAKADKFRDEGNAHFRNGEFQKALASYNRSACYALPGSRQLSLAYSNRSAVYMQAMLYSKCLENIQMSRDEGNLDDKLAEREEKCKRLMKVTKAKTDRDPWDFFKLSHPSSERIPFIVDCLELRQDDKYGRYVVTSCALRPGDVIAIEEPFYKFIDKEQRYSRCSNCLKANDLSLIPCTQCPTSKLRSIMNI